MNHDWLQGKYTLLAVKRAGEIIGPRTPVSHESRTIDARMAMAARKTDKQIRKERLRKHIEEFIERRRQGD